MGESELKWFFVWGIGFFRFLEGSEMRGSSGWMGASLFSKERQRLIGLGLNSTPKTTREDILSTVQTAWLSIDHGKVAEKGYKQTGPNMPLRGSVAQEDVFKDLLRAMEEFDPSPTPLEVGMTLRDEAVAFVREGWDAGRWSQWSDCYQLIQEQDNVDEALAEGLEAFGAEPADSESESTDHQDSEGGDDGDGGPDKLPAKTAGETGSQPRQASSQEGDGCCSGEDGSVAPGGSVVAFSPGASGEPAASAAGLELSMKVAAARQVLYEEALRAKDDAMVMSLRKRMREETENQRGAATKVATLLRERALEQREEESKRHREAREEERLAAKDLEKAKELRAKAEHAAAESRLEALKQVIVNRRDAQARRRQEIVDTAFRRWLQTQYPALLARRCIAAWRNMPKEAQANFHRMMLDRLKAGTFARQIFIKDLWACDRSFTLRWSQVTPFMGGAPRGVRCSLCFQQVVDDQAPRDHFGVEPVETLYRLFSACVPSARRVFTGSYSPLRLLHVNDYVLEKAFVYGIIALSKWLSEERFPQGVFGQWPPKAPAGLVAEWMSSDTIDLETEAATGHSLVSGHLDDAHVPPHLRIGEPASSSH